MFITGDILVKFLKEIDKRKRKTAPLWWERVKFLARKIFLGE